MNNRSRGEDGQVVVLMVGCLMAMLIAALMLSAVAKGVGSSGADQRSADLAALAAARAMHSAFSRLFEPAEVDGIPNPRHLEQSEYLELGRAAATAVARKNGAEQVAVSFPDASSFAPVRVRVATGRTFSIAVGGFHRSLKSGAHAVAEIAPLGGGDLAAFATGGGYDGPLAYRQGKPMRPDVAMAFDRMASAASADGVALTVNSGFRSDAEQAALFARNPNPRMVARPGTSLHRNATELDLGPASAYGWLSRNAGEFGFIQRYS